MRIPLLFLGCVLAMASTQLNAQQTSTLSDTGLLNWMQEIIEEPDCLQCGKIDSLYSIGLGRKGITQNDSSYARLVYFQLAKKRLMGEFDSSLALYREHKTLLESESVPTEIAPQINFCLGGAHYYLGNYDTAALFYETSSEQFKAIDSYRLYSNAMNNLAICYSYSGNRLKEMQTLQELLRLQEEKNDSTTIISTKINLGLAYYDSKLLEKAEDILNEALALSQANKDSVYMSYALSNLGNIYAEKGNYDTAIYAYKRAILLNQGKYPALIHQAYTGIGSTFYDKGLPDSAYVYNKKAFYFDNTFVDPYARVYSAINFASNCYYLDIDYELADSIVDAFLPMAIEMEILDMVGNAYAIKGQRALREENFADAQLFYEKAFNYKDSIRIVENDQLIADLEVKYEVETQAMELDYLKEENLLKEEVIHRKNWINLLSFIGVAALLILVVVILYKQNKLKKALKLLSEREKELRVVNNELKVLNENRERMIATIAHDLRGPLSGISQILKMAKEPENASQIERLVSMGHSAAKTTYGLLENLLEWAREKQGLSRFKPEQYPLSKSVTTVFAIYDYIAQQKSIHLENKVDDSVKIYADIYMLETILRNLINNALKFTKQEGTVSVLAEVKAKSVLVEVRDTGVGMDKAKLEEVFATSGTEIMVGTNNERGTGFGLRLCLNLVKRHNGKIWIESEPNQGTSFFFELPTL